MLTFLSIQWLQCQAAHFNGSQGQKKNTTECWFKYNFRSPWQIRFFCLTGLPRLPPCISWGSGLCSSFFTTAASIGRLPSSWGSWLGITKCSLPFHLVSTGRSFVLLSETTNHQLQNPFFCILRLHTLYISVNMPIWCIVTYMLCFII